MAGERVEAVGTGVIARAVRPTVGARIRTMPPRMAPKDTAGCRGGNVWGGNTTTSASSTLLATTATTTPSTIATTARVVLHILHTLYLSGKTRNLGNKLGHIGRGDDGISSMILWWGLNIFVIL